MSTLKNILNKLDDNQVLQLIVTKKHFADAADEYFWEKRSGDKHTTLLEYKKGTWKDHYFRNMRKLYKIAEKNEEDYETLLTHILILHEKYNFDYYKYTLEEPNPLTSLQMLDKLKNEEDEEE